MVFIILSSLKSPAGKSGSSIVVLESGLMRRRFLRYPLMEMTTSYSCLGKTIVEGRSIFPVTGSGFAVSSATLAPVIV